MNTITEGQDIDALDHLDLDDPDDRRAARLGIAVVLLSSQQNILGGMVPKVGPVFMPAVNKQYVAAALLLADEVLSQSGVSVTVPAGGLKLSEIEEVD